MTIKREVAVFSAGCPVCEDVIALVQRRQVFPATVRNMRQNLMFAFFYNTLCVPLVAGVLYPFFGLLLSPMIAALTMSFSSVPVVMNALHLRRATI